MGFTERSEMLPLEVIFTKNDTVYGGNVVSSSRQPLSASVTGIASVCAGSSRLTLSQFDPRLQSLNLKYETTTLAIRTKASV